MPASRRARTGLSLLLPLVVLGVLPAALLLATSWPKTAWGVGTTADTLLSAVGLAFAGGGLTLMGACIRLFYDRGQGTLAPWDPPAHLVVRGVYRYVRNPMHSGLFAVLIGEGLLLRSVPLLVLAAVVILIHLFYIPLSEERGLRARFGPAYLEYMRGVPRWIPRRRPWQPEEPGRANEQ